MIEQEDLIRNLKTDNEMLKSRTQPNHVILINGVSHYVNDSVNDAIRQLKSACDAVAASASYRMDIGAVEACRLVSKSISLSDGVAVSYDGTGNDYLKAVKRKNELENRNE